MKSLSGWMGGLVVLACFAATWLFACVSDEGNTVVPIFTDEGGTAEGGGPTLYSVGGQVTGLEGASVTLLNGASMVSPHADGAFTFPTALASGDGYDVTVQAPPAGHICSVANGMGRIVNANITNVAVSCPSTGATLSALTLSTGALSPAFAPATLAYTGSAQASLFASAPTTVTVTATAADANATLTVNGATTSSGKASAPITLSFGANSITIVVTAADKKTQASYSVSIRPGAETAYVKASNTRPLEGFGGAVALSSDGTTLAIGASQESSDAVGVGGNANDGSMASAGAVFVYTRTTGGAWSPTPIYVKASNTAAQAFFGTSVALSSDGNTLAVGATGESSNAKGIGGNQLDTSTNQAGAVYVFTRTGATFVQQAYVKASNTAALWRFGERVTLSSDGSRLAVAATGETSNGKGVNGPDTDTSLPAAGAVWVFVRNASVWTQEAYLKASNTHQLYYFGTGVAFSSDGSTLVVGSRGENSNATGVDSPNQNDTSTPEAGAAYVFTRNGTTWSQSDYIKASNPRQNANFGYSVAIAGDGSEIAIGSPFESSNAKGIGGDQTNTSESDSGAVYIFEKTPASWSQLAYVKASNPQINYEFGYSLAMPGTSGALIVGSFFESSVATGIDGDQTDKSANGTGAAYLFKRTSSVWAQSAYVKASNKTSNFATSVAISSDGLTLAIGAPGDSSDATGIDGNQADTTDQGAGAVHVFQ